MSPLLYFLGIHSFHDKDPKFSDMKGIWWIINQGMLTVGGTNFPGQNKVSTHDRWALKLWCDCCRRKILKEAEGVEGVRARDIIIFRANPDFSVFHSSGTAAVSSVLQNNFCDEVDSSHVNLKFGENYLDLECFVGY